jgi:hypothetical protein
MSSVAASAAVTSPNVMEEEVHDDLNDFMCVVSTLADDDETEKAYLKSIAPRAHKADCCHPRQLAS